MRCHTPDLLHQVSFGTFRKRVEAQIKEIGGKLDKKKVEVCANDFG